MRQPPFAASHRLATHVGPGGIISLPAPKNKGYKSGLPPMKVRHEGQYHGGEIRGAGIVHEMYKGPSHLKVEHLRHVHCNRVWTRVRPDAVAPIVNTTKPARIAYGTSALKGK